MCHGPFNLEAKREMFTMKYNLVHCNHASANNDKLCYQNLNSNILAHFVGVQNCQEV